MIKTGSEWVLWTATILALLLASSTGNPQSFSQRIFENAFDIASSDFDDDGVPNGADRCPAYTLTGNIPLLEGCTALDLVDRPFYLVEPLHAELDAVRSRIQGLFDSLGVAGMRDVAADLGSAMSTLQSATFEVKSGGVCPTAAGSPFGAVLVPTDDALSELRLRIEERKEALPGALPEGDFADHTNEELILLNMEMAESRLSSARDRAAGLVDAYEGLCEGGAGTVELTDTIEAIDTATGRLLMTSGLEVAFASGFSGGDEIYPDRQVRTRGTMVADHFLLAESMTGAGVQILPDPTLVPSDCIELRVVPVQRRPPFFSGPFVNHDPAGYQASDGNHYLESGTGFVADTSGCPDHNGGIGTPYSRYSLKLDLSYTHVEHGPTSQTLAVDLHHLYAPVYLPDGIDTAFPAALTVASRWQSCTDPGTPLPPNPDDCSQPQTQSTATLNLEVAEQDSYCNVVYQRSVFDLEDDDTSGSRRTRVAQMSLLAPFSGSITHTFRAEGYSSPTIGSSSFPFVVTIHGNEYFAIHNQDFFDPDQLYSSAVTGVDSRSGLRWPRLEGSNNGHPFRYSCDLPEIVRDAVAYCLDAPDSFYRLPFSGGYPTWIMGQGNNGSFTHNGAQAFAFDFIAPEGTSIRAARGGTVVFVRENQTGNSYDDPNCDCSANAVIIRHQDGSEALYVHMPENGVFKAVGNKVKRGEVIAEVGNTGYSTTAHLHFQEQIPDSGGMTTPSRFQAYNGEPPAPLHQCWVPDSGDLLHSNNGP